MYDLANAETRLQNNRRPYKIVTPAETIRKIRNILSGLDMFVYEKSWFHPYDHLYSVRVELDNKLLAAGANGKGMSREYALAAAYAEFMERLQNSMLFVNFRQRNQANLKKEAGFHVYPDETFLSKDSFLNLKKEILDDILAYGSYGRLEDYFNSIREKEDSRILAIPFYSPGKKEPVYIPYHFVNSLVGSNGMCAGNTPAEALYQGLCEIIERYCAREIFFRELTPPDVPELYLRQFEKEYAVIRDIQEDGKYKITVKDFSAGKKLPSVGLIIYNTYDNTYKLSNAADFSFQVALSRCLTEIYQGIGDEKRFDETMLPIAGDQSVDAKKEIKDDDRHQANMFLKYCYDGGGRFPPSLFKEKSDYKFDAATFTMLDSYEDEVDKCLDTFRGIGAEVYIRDVSFLGFPSYHIYLPEISPSCGKRLPGNHGRFFDEHTQYFHELIFRFHECSNAELEKALEFLQQQAPSETLPKTLFLDIYPMNFWENVPVSLLANIIKSRLGYRISTNGKVDERFENDFYFCTNDLLKNRTENLREDYDQSTIDIAADVVNGSYFPRCPECGSCRLRPDCITHEKIRVSKKMYARMKAITGFENEKKREGGQAKHV